jgi:hypothetical protein
MKKIKIKNKKEQEPVRPAGPTKARSKRIFHFKKKNQNPCFDFFCSTKLGIFVFRDFFCFPSPRWPTKAWRQQISRKTKKNKEEEKKNRAADAGRQRGGAIASFNAHLVRKRLVSHEHVRRLLFRHVSVVVHKPVSTKLVPNLLHNKRC